MNHKDQEGNFSREIDMFEGIISKLDELQYNTTSTFSLYTDKEKEGGNMEFRRS